MSAPEPPEPGPSFPAPAQPGWGAPQPGWGQQPPPAGPPGAPPAWGPPPPPPSMPPPPGTGWGTPYGPTGQYAYPPPAYGYTAYNPYGMPAMSYASFWARLGALLIDGLILAIPMIPVWYLLLFRSLNTACTTRLDGTLDCSSFGFPIGRELLLLGVYIVIGALYHVIPISKGGQTLGMKAVGTRVVDANTGGAIGVGRALGRFIFRSTISGWICDLGYLWMLWDDRSQTLHDKVANSIVVRA